MNVESWCETATAAMAAPDKQSDFVKLAALRQIIFLPNANTQKAPNGQQIVQYLVKGQMEKGNKGVY